MRIFAAMAGIVLGAVAFYGEFSRPGNAALSFAAILAAIFFMVIGIRKGRGRAAPQSLWLPLALAVVGTMAGFLSSPFKEGPEELRLRSIAMGVKTAVARDRGLPSEADLARLRSLYGPFDIAFGATDDSWRLRSGGWTYDSATGKVAGPR